MTDVRAWLAKINLDEYADAFEENAIDHDVLCDLNDQALKDIGVQAVGDRLRILKAIAALEADVSKSGAAPTADIAPNLTVESGLSREAERRQITVMFCDLVGSTTLSEALDPEDLRTLMQAYQKASGAVIERYEGHVAQYLGDGLMTYFGWPIAHEDDAERAARAGLEIVEAVKSVEGAPTPLQVRVGIATGRVVVGETGAGDASVPKMAVGETPNLAARIQSIAGPDEVVIGPTTQRLVGNIFTADDLGEHQLKGIPRPVPAWRISGLADAEGRFEATRGIHLTPFVGRDAEVALLMEKWELAKDGEGQIVLLCGEPGIGKSRITQVVRKRVIQEPNTRLRYQCSPYHTNSALHPVIEQLERSAGFNREDDAETLLQKLETLVGTEGNTPALFASVLSLEVPEGRYPPLNMSPQKQKDETLQALSNQVSTRSNQQPLLLIFEDAHWIDPTSQELLDLIIPSVADKRVLLIITYRPEYEPPWAQTLGHLTLINLNRLGKRQASMMVERVTGGKPLPDEVLEQIVAKTDGVPLFVEELTKTVIGSGIVKEGDEAYELTGPLTDLAIPSTIQDSLMARLDRLAPVREVAQIGACIGREFSHALLAAVSQMRGEALTDAIRHLIASELIYSVGTPPDATYTFKHALVQDAAHMSLLRTRRQQLHGQVADAMIEQFSALAEGTPETVAHHLTEARRTEQAITYWQRAGVAASQKSSNVEAVAHLEKALSLITQLPDNDDRARKELALINIVAAPMMNSRGYAAPELGRLYERAYALCEKLGGGEQIIQALSGICQYHMVVGDMNTALGYARETLARAEKQTGRGPILEAHRLLGLSYAWQGSPRKSLEHFRAVQDFYDAEQDQDLALTYGQNHLMSSYSLGACPLALLGYPNQSDVFIEKAISEAYASGHVYSIAYALTLRLVRHTCLREHSEILSGASKVIPLCEEQNIPFYLAFARLFNGFALAQQGNLDEGIERMRDALVLYGWTGSGMFLPFFDTLLAETLLQKGEWHEARDLLTFAKQRTEEWGEAFYYAETLRVLGDHEAFCPDADRKAAEIRYQEAIAAAQNRELRVWELRAAISLARLWQSQGKNREAHDLLFPISDWFTEGFDMPDLKDAKALLEELT